MEMHPKINERTWLLPAHAMAIQSPQATNPLLRYNPSAFLLGAQLIQLILFVVFDHAVTGRTLVSAFSIVILMLVVWVVDRSPALTWVAWLLAVPAFVLSILAAMYPNSAFTPWSALLEGILYFYAVGSLIAYMMSDFRVTRDELYAAGATFTLLAWGFAYMFVVAQAWVPGSFTGGAEQGTPLTFIQLLFVSFTNLSATGLSDIVPTSAATRALAILEQFLGVSYVVVVVARLVSLTTQRKPGKHD